MGGPPFVKVSGISRGIETRRAIWLAGIVLLLVEGFLLSGLVRGEPLDLCEYGKTELVFPDDPFEHRQYIGGTNLGWVKFTLLNPPYDPNVVYFQDSGHFSLHYDFISECLEPFVGIAPEEFDRLSLYAADQQLTLGAVVLPPETYGLAPIQEYGIQFVRHDAYSKEEIAALFHKVTAAIVSDPNVQVFYFPSYEQSAVAQANAEWFEAQGIPVSSAARWSRGNTIYSEGWALGRLKYVAADEIDAAYSRGELLASDILLTDAVPAEIPVLAGVISLTASTPNSHVAILSNTYGIPFVHLAEEADRQQASALEGHRVVLRAYALYSRINVDLVDANDTMTDEQAAEFLSLKQPPALDIQAVAPLGCHSAAVDSLEPSDIRYVGGKAANYSILRRAIPENSRVAMAFSFDLWNEFMDQTLAGGQTLREEIAIRLSGHTFPPVSAAVLEHELDQIRELIKDDDVTHFSPALEEAVLEALTDPAYGFDPHQKLRFRSSTNVEDSENFSGAGLYDSYSGCLADDLDDDDFGPSHCDPDQPKERGVFRAIRKVFASFYNNNAYLERLRHGLDENDVGMALLVHHSFPDEIELANGVAVLEPSSYSTSVAFVTQDGAVSVANPEPGVIPEEVTATLSSSSDDVYVRLRQYSNLMPLGQTVMAWPDDYQKLARLLEQAAYQFEKDTGRVPDQLDFEYKKIAPTGELVVKQIRQIPQSSGDVAERRFLAGEAMALSVFQGEHAEPFDAHRLKSNWTLGAASRWVTLEDLDTCLYEDATFEYHDDGQISVMVGSPTSWPEAAHEVVTEPSKDGFAVTDTWRFDHLENARRYVLTSSFTPLGTVPDSCPVVLLSDLDYALDVEYAEPVLDWNYLDGTITTTSDEATLVPVPGGDPDDLLQIRQIRSDDVTVETSFYWPPYPTGPTAGYTAPLIRWVETTVTGLTSEPITLTSEYAQTYVPGHHNFFEWFVFEPRLEAGLSQQTLEELRAHGVDLIFCTYSFGDSTVMTFDLSDAALAIEDVADAQR